MSMDKPVDETNDTTPLAEGTPEEVTIEPTPETEAAVLASPAPESSYDFGGTAADDELFVETSSELTNDEITQLNTLPTPGTVEDPAGVERIVVPDLGASGWQPAQVEPDPDEVARLERMQAALAAKKQERLESLQVKS